MALGDGDGAWRRQREGSVVSVWEGGGVIDIEAGAVGSITLGRLEGTQAS